MGAAESHEPPSRPQLPSLGARPSHVSHASPRTAPDLRPIEYTPPVQHSQIIPNLVSLRKASLTLVPAASAHHVLPEFIFDAQVPGTVTVYFHATQTVHRAGASRADRVLRVSYDAAGEPPARTKFAPGRGLRYRQKAARGLDVRLLDDTRIPIVVRLEPEGAPSVRWQVTLAGVERVGSVWEAVVRSQTVLVAGTLHVVEDLYGIGGRDVTARADGGGCVVGGDHECVICLTEPSNTAVLPCNHMCLCEECARILCTETDYMRRKCPVCRTQLGSLLRILSAPGTHSLPQGELPAQPAPPREHLRLPATDTNPAQPPGQPGADGDILPAASPAEI